MQLGSLTLSNEQRQMVINYQHLWHGLALNLLHTNGSDSPRVMAISSAVPGEGKTTSSIGLAVALAQSRASNVVLVEANLARPSLASDFQVDGIPGLIEHLLGQSSLEDICRQTPIGNLYVLPAGRGEGPNPEMLLGELRLNLIHQLPRLLDALRGEFFCVVVDLPPILGHLESEEVAQAVDGLLLVARGGVTPLEKFQQAVEQVRGSRLLGVIHLDNDSRVPGWLSRLVMA